MRGVRGPGVLLAGTSLLSCVTLGLVLAAGAHAGAVGGAPSGREVVFVANAEGGTVSIVDARTFRVLRTVNVLPDGPDATFDDDPGQALIRQRVVEAAGGKNYAQDQDISPDGRTLYVSRGHRGDVAAFDVAGGRMRWKLTIPGFRADHMTISKGGRFLYVSALTENVVVAVDTRARKVVGSFATGQWPHDNHLSEDGRRLYNGSLGNIIAPEESRRATPPPPYQLTVVNTADLSRRRTYAFDRGVRPIVIPHGERRMYAQLSELHGIVDFDLVAGRVARRVQLPVDPGVTEDDYDFEAPHHGLAISPDEKTLCAAGRASDYVALVSTASFRPVAIIEVDDAPGWATTGPDGRHCFVANTRADTLSVVSYAGRREVARIKVGDGPKQIEAARIPERVLDARGAPRRGCLARRSPIGPRNVGRVRLGHTRRRLLRRIRPQPTRRRRYAYSWCVKRSRGRVTAVFSRRSARGRARLVATTARRHGMRRVHPSVRVGRLLRSFPRARRIGRRLYRAGPRSRRIFGVRRRRVRFVAVVDRRVLRNRRVLRRYLRRAGL